MKKYRRHIAAVISITVLIILILDTKTTYLGAKAGIQLCFETLIPSLFPFLILSALCSNILLGLNFKVSSSLLGPCKFQPGTENIYIIGLLTGYPIGAKLVSDAYEHKVITKAEANRMLMFCSNAGPAFIFGIIGSYFHERWIPYVIWTTHILSSYIIGITTTKSQDKSTTSIPLSRFNSSDLIIHATKSMASICGWVIIFRTLITFLEKWLFCFFPIPLRVLLSGLLELSNGCILISQIENQGLRFMLSLLILSFGGICVTMQTATIAAGLSLKKYITGKIYQCVIAFLIAYPLQAIFFRNPYRTQIMNICFILCFILMLLFSKKIVAFRKQLIYNTEK